MELGSSRFLSLPDELIDHILSYVPLNNFLSCQLTCRRMHNINSNRQWRRHCLTQYRNWKRHDDFEKLANAAPASVNWKQLFAERKKTDALVLQNLNATIGSQTGRIANMERIRGAGYDAKDVLLKQLNVHDAAEDVLARRFWASEALGCLERSIALAEWDKLTAVPDTGSLERALGAFDVIIAQKPPESLDQISEHLDLIAERFKAEHPNHAEMPVRERTNRLANFLLANRVTGGNLESGNFLSEQVFRRLQNALISISLCDDNHPSIPIISVSIFCGVAQRVGISAAPCAYPGRVLAMVLIPLSSDADSETVEGEAIYLDVWGRVKELSPTELRNQLTVNWGYPQQRQDTILMPASPGEVMARNMRNIHESLSSNNDHIPILESPSTDALLLLNPYTPTSELDRTSLRTTLNPDRALYAIAWCTFFYNRQYNQNDDAIRTPLAHLSAALRDDFRLDIALFEKYLQPAFQTDAARSFGDSLIQEVRDEDIVKPTPKWRQGNEAAGRVRYRVGQIFRHRRYGYTAAIKGWDPQCEAGEHWIRHMRVDSLPGGRDQSFYRVLVDDESTRYVAEENIEIITPTSENFPSEPSKPPEGLMRVAGKYFKRWDASKGEFVSNVKEEYPDD